MSDLDLNERANFNQKRDTGTSQSLKDQVADAGADIKQRAGDALRASTDVARDKFKEAADHAKNLASGTADQIQQQARQRQNTGADFIGRLAGNMREAGRAFENDAPFVARGVDSAAEYVEDTADKIRNGHFNDLVNSATDFAKRQPAAFLGISVLAGFAAVRFLKASGEQSSHPQGGNRASESASAGGGNAWRHSTTSSSGDTFDTAFSSNRGGTS
jgi:gas vesicle protein